MQRGSFDGKSGRIRPFLPASFKAKFKWRKGAKPAGFSSTWRNTDNAKSKINSLKSNAARVRQSLQNNQEQISKNWLAHILPFN